MKHFESVSDLGVRRLFHGNLGLGDAAYDLAINRLRWIVRVHRNGDLIGS